MKWGFHLGFLIRFCGLGLFLLPLHLLNADIRIFRASDTHSAYSNAEAYIRTTSLLNAELKKVNPQSYSIHLVNGDIAGVSAWTYFDEGLATYKLFAHLAQDYPIVVNMGNHDGFDKRGDAGKVLFQNQSREFFEEVRKSPLNSEFKYITANMLLTPTGREFFTDHRDFISPTGKKLRIVGLVLNDLFQYLYNKEGLSL